MKLRTALRWLAGVAICGIVAIAAAGGSAADVLKSLMDFRQTIVKQAQDKAATGGPPVDGQAIQQQLKAKADEAIKTIDPAKVDPAEAMDWAQIYSIAGRTKEAQSLLASYLTSKPDASKQFDAQRLLVIMSQRNGDAKTEAATLSSMKPSDPNSSLGYAALVLGQAPNVVGELGVEKTVALIDKAVAGLPTGTLTDAQSRLTASLQQNAVRTKIQLYKDGGQRDKALALLDEALKTANDRTKGQLTVLRNQLVLVGIPAPTLKADQKYGEFPGLAGLKGKVVILDFFAHWCPPCKAEFPSMAQMYADLKPKGLEVIGVTKYYGYIGDPKVKLKPEEEYAKMADFIKEQKMTWPVVFGGQENFETYGVTAIPHVVVIGRDGVVHHLDIGYSPALFAKFRKTVEEILDKK